MTATPHNGKEEDFQLFLALLDGDRFEGRFRDGVHVADVSDPIRRMVKERLLKFDGKPLFPEGGAVVGALARPDRRDRLLLLSALAIAVLSLLGAAGERIGYDRWLKANTVRRRTHSLFRQGLMLYHHLPNWPEDRIRPLMETFGSMLMEQRVYREVFGVI